MHVVTIIVIIVRATTFIIIIIVLDPYLGWKRGVPWYLYNTMPPYKLRIYNIRLTTFVKSTTAHTRRSSRLQHRRR